MDGNVLHQKAYSFMKTWSETGNGRKAFTESREWLIDLKEILLEKSENYGRVRSANETVAACFAIGFKKLFRTGITLNKFSTVKKQICFFKKAWSDLQS